MKILNFATSNKNKVREFKAIFGKDYSIKHINIKYRELRSDNPEDIARESAKKLANKLKKPVIVEDSGLFIRALNGFPGTCSAYIHKRIGLNGILKLMENIKNRECIYKSAIGFCIPGKEPLSFLGEEKGKIAEEIMGSYGFGHDPIFIPQGSWKTYGEIKNAEKSKKFRKRAAEKLREYLNKKDY